MKTTLKTRLTKTKRDGFSLAELMVVIVILGLLATIAVQNIPALLRKAFGGTVKANITAISTAVDTYLINNNGRAPDTLEELITPDENNETYLRTRKVPADPWGNEFLYEPPMPGTRGYRIYTYGKDGVPGGEGEDMDISNWMIEDGEV